MRRKARGAVPFRWMKHGLRSLHARGAGVVLSLSAAVSAAVGCAPLGSLPSSPGPQGEPGTVEETAIERREICIGSSVASAGDLGDTIYYRAAMLPDGKLAVGYFAFWSDERPWGNNWLTWTLVPALAVDMFYTRGMFVAPGLQRVIHGKGDVEGVRVLYDLRPDGVLQVEHAVADDGTHAPVHFDAREVMALDPARPTFVTDVWSHQLGGKGVRRKSELAYLRCFGPGHVRALPEAIARDFSISGRATPAQALGGRLIGGPGQAVANDERPPHHPLSR